MADAYTTATLNSVQTAYERMAYFALRPELYFDQLAEVKSSADGSAVKFTIWGDMTVVTTSLNESVDVDAVAITDSQITVTPAEYGNAAITTFKLRATSFMNVDRDVANVVGQNAGESVDTIALNTLKAGTNVLYATGGATDPTARNTIEPGDTISAHDIRRAVAELRSSNVRPYEGGWYAGFMHPDVSVDLREETGTAAWIEPSNYSDATRRWNGEVGRFEGVRWIETPRAPVWADAGSSTTLTDVYGTIIMGRQALAKAYSSELGPLPRVVIGPETDKLRRLHTIGWHAFLGYGIFRQAALYRIESASSIGANA